MRRIEFLIARLATVDSSVLITGESGVGKEMVARLLHDNSQRADGPMVCVNCTAIPETLFESELFGHERGAFTGADRRRIGRFEQAEGGTLFLDEVAEIPPSVQVKLLRALQEREVERLGGDRTIPVDARIVAATQVDLDTAVDEGRFRPDLFWRLNVIHIDVPPLRERQADILHLANRFIAWHAKEMEKTIYGLSAEAESALQNMDFPGNVRELKNLLERAVALAEGRLIEPSLFLPVCAPSAPSNVQTQTTTLKDAVENAERAAILEALQQCHWVIGKTADSLSISRKNLWEKMKRYHINH